MSEYIVDIYDFVREKADLIKEVKKEEWEFKRQNPEIPNGTVIDREQSVRWNEEEVVHRNNSRKSKLGVFTKKHNALVFEMQDGIEQSLQQEYSLSKDVAHMVFARAYDNAHSGGYLDVAIEAKDLASFVRDILEIAT